MRLRLAAALAVALALFARAEIAHAECTEAGACPSNQYCALDDGGVVVTDGGAGACFPEPCIVSTDCPNDELCDTNGQPFKCVECISTADCPGTEHCDVQTHTCFEPPEAGPEEAGAGEGGESDGGESVDATTPVATNDASSGADANASANEAGAPGVVDAGPPDTGSLGGGAFDCALATPIDPRVAAFASPLLVGLVLIARRRARRSRRPRA